MVLLRVLALVTFLLGHTVANIHNANLDNLLASDGKELAMMFAPVFFFKQATRLRIFGKKYPPAYPTWAFSGKDDAPDVFDDSHKTPPADRCDSPDAGCKARNPGVDPGNESPSFPIYYTWKRCGEDEIRIAYNLFYEKDGMKMGTRGERVPVPSFLQTKFSQSWDWFRKLRITLLDTGHEYDWEHVIVSLHRNPLSNLWDPTHLLLSQYGGHEILQWSQIQNTVPTWDLAQLADLRHLQRVKYQDHAKVFVGWSKHSHYNKKLTGYPEALLQLTPLAIRGDDWWRYVSNPEHYVWSDPSTAAGRALNPSDRDDYWGERATKDSPGKIHERLCEIGRGRVVNFLDDTEEFQANVDAYLKKEEEEEACQITMVDYEDLESNDDDGPSFVPDDQ